MKFKAKEVLGQPELLLNSRVNAQLPYLTTHSQSSSSSSQGLCEYWFDLETVKRILDEGTFLVVSPLRAENAAEVELSEESEELLEWILANSIQHVHVESVQ